MTPNDGFNGLVERYLDEYEGSTPMPVDVRDAVRARIPSITQRPAWWPGRRFPAMNNAMRIAVAAAAVLATALLGYTALIGGQNVGGPDNAPSGTALPSASPDAVSYDTHPGGRLAPGTYSLMVLGRELTFEVPSGWQKNVVPGVLWTPNSEARVGFGTLDNINVDPCQPELGELDPPPGPDVADLAVALTSLPGVEATSTDTEVSGHAGRLVTLQVPDAFADCIQDGGEALLTGDAGSGPVEPGVHRFWIVEVGGARLVITAVHRPEALDRHIEQIDAIIESVRIREP